MGLFNALRTSVSGMNAQSSYLSAIGDNIANSSTVGYKDAQTQFETVLGEQTPGSYESGGVLAQTRYGVTQQGTLSGTSSSTDLAINGNGFFVVSDGNNAGQYLTRAGSFVADKNGNLVNTAGYTLMGYAMGADGTPSTTLSDVNVNSTSVQANPSTSGTLKGNLPSSDVVANPSATPPVTATAARTASITVYDSLGTPNVVNMSFQKDPSVAGQWNVTATDASGASVLTGTSTSITFDMNGVYASGSPLQITTNGTPAATVSLDLSSMTQLDSGVSVQSNINGNAASSIASVTVGTDGTLTGIYGSGAKAVLYQIPLATVTSPNNLTSINGNLYQESSSSGSIVIQSANTGGTGKIESDNLELSTVDLATELTNMITAQRAYEANSKVLQAASDLLSKLNQIQTN